MTTRPTLGVYQMNTQVTYIRGTRMQIISWRYTSSRQKGYHDFLGMGSHPFAIGMQLCRIIYCMTCFICKLNCQSSTCYQCVPDIKSSGKMQPSLQVQARYPPQRLPLTCTKLGGNIGDYCGDRVGSFFMVWEEGNTRVPIIASSW